MKEVLQLHRRFHQVLQPGYRLYFAVLIAFVAAAMFFSYALAFCEAAVAAILYIFYRRSMIRRRRELLRYIENVSFHVKSAAKGSVLDFPLPIVIIRPEDGRVIWSNERFSEITGKPSELMDSVIEDYVPDFSAKWILEGRAECPYYVTVLGKSYMVFGNLVREDMGGLIATLFWTDVTEFVEIREEYNRSRPVVSIIVMDNYEELMKNASDANKSAILAAVDEKVSRWIEGCDGLIRKFDRDKYVFIFEDRHLGKFIRGKFSLLESVRAVKNAEGIPVTLSIGIGKDGAGFRENYSYAALAVDMALSRGGDQAVVKNKFSFDFYGGSSKELEKRTKVKSRVLANALSELITSSSKVLVMGHKAADLDSVGAAAGIACAARKKGVPAYIITDLKTCNALALVQRLGTASEYERSFITLQDAVVLADGDTLLVVVDTNRPEYVEAPELLYTLNRIAVIDHHRRAATYIENAAMSFHEPYASSASELVTELLQHITEPSGVLRVEAEALLSGIVLDTKNFTINTGARTFEAASFLRRCGADTVEIKKLLQSDLQSHIERYGIIKDARVYRESCIISASGPEVSRATAAQASDELLCVTGILASFVICRDPETVFISARSLGKVNVQMILEKLGGGGHLNVAGAQFKNVEIGTVYTMLTHAIDEYFDNI